MSETPVHLNLVESSHGSQARQFSMDASILGDAAPGGSTPVHYPRHLVPPNQSITLSPHRGRRSLRRLYNAIKGRLDRTHQDYLRIGKMCLLAGAVDHFLDEEDALTYTIPLGAIFLETLSENVARSVLFAIVYDRFYQAQSTEIANRLIINSPLPVGGADEAWPLLQMFASIADQAQGIIHHLADKRPYQEKGERLYQLIAKRAHKRYRLNIHKPLHHPGMKIKGYYLQHLQV